MPDFSRLTDIFSNNSTHKLLSSLVIIIGMLLIRFLLRRIITTNISDITTSYKLKRIVSASVTCISLILIGIIWFQNGNSLPTFLGLFSAGMAIALHDTISNIIAWGFIIVRRPFEMGNRIEIHKIKGDVIDIRLLQFSVLEVGGDRVGSEQSTGRIVHIPNSTIFKEPLANYNLGFAYIWDEIPILLTFESDWEKGKKILLSIVKKNVECFSETAAKEIRKTAQTYMIIAGKLTPTVYTSIEESGILLSIRFLVKSRKQRDIEQAIIEEMLKIFTKDKSIDFAYPTIRYYNQALHNSKNK